MAFDCFLCPKDFDNLKAAVDHLKKEHKIKNNTIDIKCMWNFSVCKKTFLTISGLNNHMKTYVEVNQKIEVF